MATIINREDSKTCFNCDSKPPLFRLISLEKFLTENGSLEPDCLVGLFCESCLRLQIEDLFAGFSQSKTPVSPNETPDRCLCRQVGFVVVPIEFGHTESQLLIDELGLDSCVTVAD
jgi:hypothetical protein